MLVGICFSLITLLLGGMTSGRSVSVGKLKRMVNVKVEPLPTTLEAVMWPP